MLKSLPSVFFVKQGVWHVIERFKESIKKDSHPDKADAIVRFCNALFVKVDSGIPSALRLPPTTGRA